MGKTRIWLPCYYLFMILVLGFSPCILCSSSKQSPANTAVPVLASFIYNQLANLTKVFHTDITKALGFCINDVDAELFEAFNFRKNLEFLNNCFKETNDVTQRLCNAAEMKFYFSSFLDTKSAKKTQVLRPNRNCNLTSWVPGCEPGWSCSVGTNQKVDLKNAKDMPDRTRDNQPCCEGFFCPRGLTCMIPCPLGAYCPRATLNKTTGVCDPYSYQLPPGKVNHTCGAADLWGSETSGGELFCSPGSYCPTTTKKVTCSEGNYCRKGSTEPKPCIKLSQCHAQSDKQKLHVYGFILIGVLSFILILVYNCSDQVINTKYRRVAKSREAAARHARETAQARERWGLVKDVAKKRAFGLQQQLSRTFSKKTSVKQGPRGGFNLPKTNDEASSIPPKGPSSSAGSSKGKKKGQSDLTKMMHSIENESDNIEGFHMQIGDKNIKKQALNAKQLHTRSQIFKYAYGQLEKEKAMEQKTKNMTFSGVISMATDDNTEIKTRPPIEIAFKDLTITLKKKHKHLMRSVTGKLMPGRISAVMGPSGAGKTTFLSAVAGKITQCTLSGMVLINGRAESMDSYKKIIGYVAQDDIVHGNLTVEENLRFNARCRLAADLPKADKVLVVERVIESLGLQAVRDSLVGTVERRGISGGQRKRVNVGMEMVMEPSLLILDEPTSGLDSSSSNLLLKALRREALEGVNICMVVHQPSYTLYKMFDDLVLLAKGGLVAYHGPVKKVEEYFASLGITVPDRVNPPDHFIDILEGMVKPGGGVTVEQLPVRWMLHNGYPVPPDMMQLCDQIAMSSKGVAAAPDQSFSVDGWHEKRDSLSHSLLKPHDLSNRNTPGVNRQYRYYLGRVGKQRLREAQVQGADYLILLVAGACLGILSNQKGDTFGYYGYMYSVIAVSLLCKIAALRSFSLDKLEYWRERESGMSSLAYFLSKDTIDHFNTLIKPLVFLSMFYFLNSPRSTFGDNYLVFLCLVYCVTGIAYVFAICFAPGQAQLWCVLVPVVLTLIANQEPDGTVGKYVAKFCYPRWAMEAFVVASAQRYSGVWLITRCGKLLELGFDVHNWTYSLILLVLTGVVSRLIAYLCLVCIKKK
ncbi:putative white-brown complex homolog protein 30 [Lycium ferocissimum]|uniref:putative white-brown complex homolog protein 30 n=1 Tax=Lycium ferocissimum TaxID=112874 RepID=UPI002814BA06|nr:putative white-brown complex homolog protein 30 [Lycium ferocissimum]